MSAYGTEPTPTTKHDGATIAPISFGKALRDNHHHALRAMMRMRIHVTDWFKRAK